MAQANSAAASDAEIKRRSRASRQAAECREREREMLSRIRTKIEHAMGKARDGAREAERGLGGGGREEIESPMRGDARRRLLREWIDSLGLAFRPAIANQLRHELQRLMTGMERNEIELQVAEFEVSLKNKIKLQLGFGVSVKNVIDLQVAEFDVSLKNEIEVRVAEFEISLIKERVCKRLKERLHESNNDIPKHFEKSLFSEGDGVKHVKERITINSLTSNAQIFCGLCNDKHEGLSKNNDIDPPLGAYKAPPASAFRMTRKQSDEGGRSEIVCLVKKDTAPSRATDSTCEMERRRLDGSPRMSAPVTFTAIQAADCTTMPPLTLMTMHGGKSFPHNRNLTPDFSSFGNKRSSLADQGMKPRATAAAPGGERFNLSGPHLTPAALAPGGGAGMAWRAMSISERIMRATGTRDDIVGIPPLPAPGGPGSLRDMAMVRMTMASNPNLREGSTMNAGRARSSRGATRQNSRARCGENDDDVADILLSLCGRKRPLSEEQLVETEIIKRHIKHRIKEIVRRKISRCVSKSISAEKQKMTQAPVPDCVVSL